MRTGRVDQQPDVIELSPSNARSSSSTLNYRRITDNYFSSGQLVRPVNLPDKSKRRPTTNASHSSSTTASVSQMPEVIEILKPPSNDVFPKKRARRDERSKQPETSRSSSALTNRTNSPSVINVPAGDRGSGIASTESIIAQGHNSSIELPYSAVTEAKSITIINTNGANTNFFSSPSLTLTDPILDSFSLSQSMLPSTSMPQTPLSASTCASCSRKPKMVNSETQCNLYEEVSKEAVDHMSTSVSVGTMTERIDLCSSEMAVQPTENVRAGPSAPVSCVDFQQPSTVPKQSEGVSLKSTNEAIQEPKIDPENQVPETPTSGAALTCFDDSDSSDENDDFFADLLFKNIDNQNGASDHFAETNAEERVERSVIDDKVIGNNSNMVASIIKPLPNKTDDEGHGSGDYLYDNISDVSSSESSEPEEIVNPLTFKIIETKSLAPGQDQLDLAEAEASGIQQGSLSDIVQTSSPILAPTEETVKVGDIEKPRLQNSPTRGSVEMPAFSGSETNESSRRIWTVSNLADTVISIKSVELSKIAGSSTIDENVASKPSTGSACGSECEVISSTVTESEARSEVGRTSSSVSLSPADEFISENFPSQVPFKFGGHLFSHPTISPKKVELEDLDGFAKLSYLSAMSRSDQSSKSVTSSCSGKKGKRSHSTMVKSTLSSSSDEEFSRTRSSLFSSPYRSGKLKTAKRRKTVLNCDDSDHEMRAIMKMPKISKQKASSSKTNGSSPRKSTTSSTSNVRQISVGNTDDSDNVSNEKQSQSLFPKVSKNKKNKDAHRSMLLDSDCFEEEISHARTNFDDTTDIDSLDEANANEEDFVLGEEDLDLPLKVVSKKKEKVNVPKQELDPGSEVNEGSQKTIILSSGSETVEIVPKDKPFGIERPSLLRKLNVGLKDDCSKRQTTLNLNRISKKPKKEKLKSAPRVRRVHNSSSSEIDSYEISTDEDNSYQPSAVSTSRAATSSAAVSSYIASSSSTSKTASTLMSETTSGASSSLNGFNNWRKKAGCRKFGLKAFKLSDSEGSRGDSGDDQPMKDVCIVKKTKSRSLNERQKRLMTQNNSDEDDEVIHSQGRKSARKPRAILSARELNQQTRKAAKEEKDRIVRVKSINREGLDAFTETEQGKVYSHVWLEKCPKENQPLVDVNENIVGKLKEHQVQGVHFMYDCTVESVKRAKKFEGAGCILAHCMGLGKTLQVVSFLDAVLTSPNLKQFKSALIIAPCSTLDNWKKEFKFWLLGQANFNVLNLDKYKNEKSLQMQALQYWSLNGGVMICGYEAFAILVRKATEDNDEVKKNESSPKISKPKPKSKQPMSEEYKEIVISSLLDPGPDFVICDEGHMLKNDKTMKAQSINKIRTLRRIMLTGTPLQNNLDEYYVMSNFVKPHLLGTKKEFRNRFSGPITRGQQKDANRTEVKRMQRQSHVLHKQLSGCVDRKDFSYIKKMLPPKYEYTLEIRLSQLQIDLYAKYLALFIQASSQVGVDVDEMEQVEIKKIATTKGNLLKNCHAFARILAHPVIFKSKQADNASTSKNDDDDFGFDKLAADILKVPDNAEDNTSNAATGSNEDLDKEWVEFAEAQLVAHSAGSKNLFDINASGKFVLLCEILKMCHQKGDKLLLFSQRIDFLDLIENMFKMLSRAQSQKWQKGVAREDGFVPTINGLEAGDCKWIRDQHYFRLDGSTSTKERKRICKKFNNPQSNVRLMLISTRAGSLGINLIAANRVILFDASWNPSQDIQSMFRVYRFGQTKPCYIYRFISKGTFEQKIYFRQVLKESLSERVVDKNAKERNFTKDDVTEFYRFTVSMDESPVPTVPADNLLADLVLKHQYWIGNHYEHDTLLQDDVDDLNEEEKRIAWEEYERERERAHTPPPNVMKDILGSEVPGPSDASASSIGFAIPSSDVSHNTPSKPFLNPIVTPTMQPGTSTFIPLASSNVNTGGGLMGSVSNLNDLNNQQLPSLINTNLPLPPMKVAATNSSKQMPVDSTSNEKILESVRKELTRRNEILRSRLTRNLMIASKATSKRASTQS